MRDDRFEWDDAKAASNSRMHGVTFEMAREAFAILIVSARASASFPPARQIDMSKIVTKGKRVLKDDVWHDENGELPGTPADWVPSMTEAEKHAAALSDPDCQPTPPGKLARIHRIARAKFIRHKLGMSQEEFARRFHIPMNMLRDWEHHLSEPDTAMLAYLQVIEREPDTVERALSTVAAE